MSLILEPPTTEHKPKKCNFCGKSKEGVEVIRTDIEFDIVEETSVKICNECIDLSHQIMEGRVHYLEVNKLREDKQAFMNANKVLDLKVKNLQEKLSLHLGPKSCDSIIEELLRSEGEKIKQIKQLESLLKNSKKECGHTYLESVSVNMGENNPPRMICPYCYIQELHQDSDEEDKVRGKLANLLNRCNAILKPPAPENVLLDWSDIPDLIQNLKNEANEWSAQAAAERGAKTELENKLHFVQEDYTEAFELLANSVENSETASLVRQLGNWVRNYHSLTAKDQELAKQQLQRPEVQEILTSIVEHKE